MRPSAFLFGVHLISREREGDNIRRNLENITATHGTCAVLERLSCAMLAPDTQKHEFRYLHLANMILELPIRPGQSGQILELQPVLAWFDDSFGPVFSPQEVDFIYIPFLCWVDWKGNTYRAFSGTFAEPEIYFADLIEKGASLDGLLNDKFGFAFSDLVDLILPRMHRYIQETGRYQQESNDSNNMSAPDSHVVVGSDEDVAVWRQCFVISRDYLTEPQKRILSRISCRPGQYNANLERLFAGQADVMRYPVVKTPEEFVIVCPQLAVPALLTSVTNELSKNHKLHRTLLAHVQERLLKCLRQKFSTEPAFVLKAPTCDGHALADIMVYFDRKLLMFSVFGEDLSLFKRLTQRHRIGSKAVTASKTRLLVSEDGNIKVDQGPLEYLHFFVVDTYGELEFRIPEHEIPQDEIGEILSIKSLEHVLGETDNALHFIKFFRMRRRARTTTKTIIETGRPILDSFAIFKQKQWLNPFVLGRPTLLVEVHSFGKYHLEQLVKHRQTHALHQINGTPKRWKIYYPGCLQRFESDSIVSLIDLQNVTLTIRGKCPTEEIAFKIWHVSLDSICYHLSTKASTWKALFHKNAPEISSVEISIEYQHQSGSPLNVEVTEQDGTLIVKMQISSEMQQVFLAGNNSGERLVVGTLVKAIGLIEAEEFDMILPASVKRRSQLTLWRSPHESWNDGVEAIPLYECDEEMTVGAERQSLLKSGMKPGYYRTKSQIYTVLGNALKALREALLVKIQMYDRNMLITFSYMQLEAAYIANEVKKQELAFSSQTAEFVDIEQEYIQAVKAGVDLTFAARLVLETALQNDTSGSSPVTLEVFSEMIAFANQIMLLDSFGDQLGALERAGCDLPVVELTERFIAKIHAQGDQKNDLPKFLFELQKRDIENPEPQLNDTENQKQRLWQEFATTFDEALLDEYGFSMTQRLHLDTHLMQIFRKRKIPVLSIDRLMLIDMLINSSGFPKIVVHAYVNRLVLSRELLQDNGQIKPSERYWRDARILNRPLVSVEGETLLFAHTVVGLSSQVFVERLMKARTPSDSIDKNSKLAKAIGKWANEQGEAFKNKIMAFLRDLDWEVYPEVKSFGNISMPDEGMGPLDLICINRIRKQLIFVEAKQNYFSRNAKDLRNELDYFFGHEEERGEFRRFIEKIEWALSHKEKLADHFVLASQNEWKLESLFVTSELLYCKAFRQPPFRVMTEAEFHRFILGIDS